jgi:hypothetical protein
MRYMIGMQIVGFVERKPGIICEELATEFISYQPVLSLAAKAAVEASQEPKNRGLIIAVVDTVGIGTVAFEAMEMDEGLQEKLDGEIQAGFRKFETIQKELEKTRDACDCAACSRLQSIMN